MPTIVVREESRSYPESTERLIGQLGDLSNHQTALPRIARDPKLTALIEKAVQELPTQHDLYRHDARDLSMITRDRLSAGPLWKDTPWPVLEDEPLRVAWRRLLTRP